MADYVAGELYSQLDGSRQACVDRIILRQWRLAIPYPTHVPWPTIEEKHIPPDVDTVPLPMRLLRYKHQYALGFCERRFQ